MIGQACEQVGVIGVGIIGVIGEGAAPHGAPSTLSTHSSIILSVRPALRLCVLCERKLMNDAVISRGYTWPASSRSRAEAQRRKDLASLLLGLRKTIGIIGVGVIGIIGIRVIGIIGVIGVIGKACAPHERLIGPIRLIRPIRPIGPIRLIRLIRL